MCKIQYLSCLYLINHHVLLFETSPLLETPAKAESQSRVDEQLPSLGWWIIQLLLVVPVPVTLLVHILVLLVDSLSQTLSDGNNPIIGSSALFLSSLPDSLIET